MLSHADMINDLVEGTGPGEGAYPGVAAVCRELALRDAKIHAVLNSSDVMGGNSPSSTWPPPRPILTPLRAWPEVIVKAMDDAARSIHDDQRRAAQIYLTHQQTEVMNGTAVEDVDRVIRSEFVSAVYGVKAIARISWRSARGELATVPQGFQARCRLRRSRAFSLSN